MTIIDEMRVLLSESTYTGYSQLIAFNDSLSPSKRKADVVCDGAYDDVEINTALTSLS